MIPGTLRELFTFNDWARDKILAAVAERSDEELDRPFEMGEGSLRKTVFHLWEAEEVWLSRWLGLPFTEVAETLSPGEILKLSQDTTARREHWLATLDLRKVKESFTYARPRWMGPGGDLQLPHDVSLLHVLNHGIHHRTQAVNMLKRLGVAPPTPEYIIMRLNGERPDPPLDLSTLRRYTMHSDWAYRQVHEAGASLLEEAQSREFPVGPGTLKKIMRHLADAPAWWMDNINNGPSTPFPAIDASSSWQDLWPRYREAALRRDSYLDSVSDADLERPITVVGRPGVERAFPLGVAMLQVCAHSTHHCAQALNMLRHSGATVPTLDVAVWHRQGAPSVLHLHCN